MDPIDPNIDIDTLYQCLETGLQELLTQWVKILVEDDINRGIQLIQTLQSYITSSKKRGRISATHPYIDTRLYGT